MTANPYLQRVEEEVHAADPTRLIAMLYQALGERLRTARTAMQAGQIRERAAAISQAVAIVGELAQCLDAEADPQLAARLSQLYDYIIDRLITANSQQIEEPLAEAMDVVSVLAEAWNGIAASGVAAPAAVPAAYADASSPRLSYCG
jgi:flagellar secretion chaperone FliS